MHMMINKYELYKFSLPPIDSNMYVLIDGCAALVIDPNENEEMIELLKQHNCKEITVILSHEHFDHICGVNAIREFAEINGGTCKVYAQKNCAEAIERSEDNLAKFFLALYITHPEEERALAAKLFDPEYVCSADFNFIDNYDLCWGDLRLVLKSTPGHSPGSICIEIYDKKMNMIAVATGDSLILNTPVITRIPRGNKTDYKEITVPYLKGIPLEALILPGHGEISIMKNFNFE